MAQQNMLPMISDRFLNTPLMLDPRKASVIYGVLQGRISPNVALEISDADAEIDTEGPEASRFKGSRFTGQGKYSIVRREGGVAIISITGSLVNRGAWIGAYSGLVSYEGIAAEIDTAMKDTEIHSILLDINSPGGEATGMFGVAQKVREAAAEKPVVAVVNDIAASAAYGIASGAHEIVISPTSFTGSIGVVMVHMDHSGELKKKGVKPTILQKGANKTHGNPFGPLSGDAVSSLNEMMTVLYDQFLETVAAGRGSKLDAAAARATEAGIFVGAKAVDAGVADRVGTFDDVLAELQTSARSGITTEKDKMSDNNKGPDSSANTNTFTQADVDAAHAAGRVEGTTQATERFGAIMGSDAAKGREATAAAFAVDPDMSMMSADAVIRVLGKAEKEAPQAESVPTPGQRADDLEIGSEDPKGDGAGAKSNGWRAVTDEYNASV